MSEKAEVPASKSAPFLLWEDWIVLLTGVVSSSAIGWAVYRGLKSHQIDFKTMIITGSLFGGMGVYFTSAAIILMRRESSRCREKSETSISEKDYPNLPAQNCETSPSKRLVNITNELDGKLAYEDSKMIVDLAKIIRGIQEAAKMPCTHTHKSEDTTKILNYLNQQGSGNGVLEHSAGYKRKIFCDGDIEIQKMKLREEIISFLNGLKGYVEGTIDPLPLVRNIQFRSSEMSHEMSRQVAMIIKEYVDRKLPKLEKAIDNFMNSVCKPEKVIDNKEHEVKNELKTIKVPEKDQSTMLPNIDMNVALENGIRSSPGQKWQGSKNILRIPHEPCSKSSLQEKNVYTKMPEISSPTTPHSAIPTTERLSFLSQNVNRLDHHAVEKLKNPFSNLPKLNLNQEQTEFLNVLKSEI